MTFSISFDPHAEKEFLSLEKPLRERIIKKLELARTNPKSFFERLEDRDDYKLRIGDYRLIADIDFNSKKIDVTKVGHRKNVYD